MKYVLVLNHHVVWLDGKCVNRSRDILPVFTSPEKAAAYRDTFDDLSGAAAEPVSDKWIAGYTARKNIDFTIDHPGQAEVAR